MITEITLLRVGGSISATLPKAFAMKIYARGACKYRQALHELAKEELADA